MGLGSRRHTHAPLLNKLHRKLHLHWEPWLDQWKRIAWSNQSWFIIHHVDNCIRVCHFLGEKSLSQCTADHTQAAGGSIMLWRPFLGPVVVVDQTMKAVDYVKISCTFKWCLSSQREQLQQVNVPCHKAWIVLEWSHEHNVKFQLMPWLSNSLDLNPIQHIWGVMEP